MDFCYKLSEGRCNECIQLHFSSCIVCIQVYLDPNGRAAYLADGVQDGLTTLCAPC